MSHACVSRDEFMDTINMTDNKVEENWEEHETEFSEVYEKLRELDNKSKQLEDKVTQLTEKVESLTQHIKELQNEKELINAFPTKTPAALMDILWERSFGESLPVQ